MKVFTTFALLFLCVLVGAKTKPNIIYILTDDQDVLLNSLDAMSSVHHNLTKQGLYFNNAFATTPVCCPSRSSILTGKYVHNHGTYENSVASGCASDSWRKKNEGSTVAAILSKAGYKTGLFGKYLNNYGMKESRKDYTYKPTGWDTWYALVGNSKYYDYTVSNNRKEEKHGNDYDKDYFTDRVRDMAVEFIKDNVKDKSPFFAYIAPPAPHRPATPAPKFSKNYFKLGAPRTKSYGVVGINKHWMISIGTPPLDRETTQQVDSLYKDRLRSLMSVDVLVDTVLKTLENEGVLNNTYIIFHSDHGYHLGQFSQQGEKRQPYETDIRVPLIIRGPGVSKNSTTNTLALNIDIAPTIIDLAGGKKTDMDGVSLKSTITASEDEHDEAERSDYNYQFMLEYYGDTEGGNGGCWSDMGFLRDCHNNTWLALRYLNSSAKTEFMYASFYKNDTFPINPKLKYFTEYYNLVKDPWELSNKAKALSDDFKAKIEDTIDQWYKCSGTRCHDLRTKGLNP